MGASCQSRMLWLAVLLPPLPGESNELAAARAGLNALDQIIPSLATTRIRDWRRRLSRPSDCAVWLEAEAVRIRSTLDVLYVARNLAFHDGVFSHHADKSLAHAGVMLADLTLEILGNWYKAEAQIRPSAPPTPADRVVQLLATRHTNLIDALRVAVDARRLSVQHITGPTSDGWDRED